MAIRELAELTWEEVRDLDLSRTVAVLPVGAVEAHGPHLPSGSDVFETDEASRRTASRLTDSLSGWNIVLMPMLTYGVDGANNIPDRPDIRGTFSLRATTLRSILVDLGT